MFLHPSTLSEVAGLSDFSNKQVMILHTSVFRNFSFQEGEV
jgi:hypothetical protein